MRTAKSAARVPRSRRSKPRALTLSVQYATRSRHAPTESQIEEWVRAALEDDAEVTVRVVAMTEGRELNRAYRGKDYATNVLTFVMNDSPPYQGDLALCAPVVAREAREQGKPIAAHYAHLTIHGILHLQGYEHENELDAVRMERLETRILQRLGYPDPYTATSPHGRHPQ
jgi:probable rRNA maturation factor